MYQHYGDLGVLMHSTVDACECMLVSIWDRSLVRVRVEALLLPALSSV